MKKTKLTTTFALLREHGACVEGYRKLAKHLGGVDSYGENTPINLLTILESNGIDDMAWCLCATRENSDKVARLFAADCAEAVLHIYEREHPGDDRPRKAIQAARDYANGAIDAAASAAASAAAWDAASAAASAAAWAAARDAASAAWDAAWDAASAARDDQGKIARRYLAPDRKVAKAPVSA